MFFLFKENYQADYAFAGVDRLINELRYFLTSMTSG